MSRAASLSVIAIGAIFAFAITASPTFLNLQVVGWILMATGVAGMLLQQRNRDWLRRTVIVRRAPGTSRSYRRRIAAPASGEPPAPDQPTEPIGETGQTVERETVEEYIEP